MAAKDWYVICPDYVAGPYTQDQAQARAAQPNEHCAHEHRAERHDRKPEAEWRLRYAPAY